MKNLFFIFLFLPAFTSAQYKRTLDTASIFKTLRLGFAIKDYDLKFKIESTSTIERKIYSPINKQYFKQPDFDMRNIYFTTYNDTVRTIKFILDGNNGLLMVRKMLDKYGNPDKIELDENGFSFEWRGKSVDLNIWRYKEEYSIVFLDSQFKK